MLISFSGAQSTGKSTLLNILKDHNPDIYFVDEVTRRIKRKFNMPINEEGGDLTQYMIMNDHIANVANVYRATYGEHSILDRCALDGIVYTKWLYDNGNVSAIMFDAAEHIYNKLINCYDVIFYTDTADVPLEDDGERSANVKFREDIVSIFNEYKRRLTNIVILKGTVEQRLKTVKETLAEKSLDIKIN